MMQWIAVGTVVLVIIIGLAIIFRSDDRREAKAMDQERRDLEEWQRDVSEEGAKADAVLARVAPLPWPEVRALCEQATGRPCECSTRQQAARSIYNAEARREANGAARA